MTTTGTTRLGDILLIIGCFEMKNDPTFDPATLRNIGDNSRFEFNPQMLEGNTPVWKGDHQSNQHLHGPFFCLPLTHPPDNPEGWVFGSSAHKDACHFRLAEDNQTGISRQSFSIDLVWPQGGLAPVPRLKLFAGKSVLWPTSGRSEVLEWSGSTWIIFEPTVVEYNQLSFRVWTPILPYDESFRYLENVLHYLRHTLNCLFQRQPPSVPQVTYAGRDEGLEGANLNARYAPPGWPRVRQ